MCPCAESPLVTAGGLVLSVKAFVHRGPDKNQSPRGDERPSDVECARARKAPGLQRAIGAQRHLPADFAPVQIHRRERAPWPFVDRETVRIAELMVSGGHEWHLPGPTQLHILWR